MNTRAIKPEISKSEMSTFFCRFMPNCTTDEITYHMAKILSCPFGLGTTIFCFIVAFSVDTQTQPIKKITPADLETFIRSHINEPNITLSFKQLRFNSVGNTHILVCLYTLKKK